jgi:superfamily II DNA helicase RecQ
METLANKSQLHLKVVGYSPSNSRANKNRGALTLGTTKTEYATTMGIDNPTIRLVFHFRLSGCYRTLAYHVSSRSATIPIQRVAIDIAFI